MLINFVSKKKKDENILYSPKSCIKHDFPVLQQNTEMLSPQRSLCSKRKADNVKNSQNFMQGHQSIAKKRVCISPAESEEIERWNGMFQTQNFLDIC